MSDFNQTFHQPLAPWPSLQPFAREVRLAQDNLSLFLYEAGQPDAPPLLLIHGLGDDADTWRHLIPTLATDFRVIAPDLPGFGRSAQPLAAPTPSYLRDVLLGLLDAVVVTEALVVGHSMGAALAQLVALEAPQRARALLLIDGGIPLREQPLTSQLLLFLIPVIGEWGYGRLRKDPQAAFDSLRPYFANLDRVPQQEKEFLFTRVNQRVHSDALRRGYLSTLRHMVWWMARHVRHVEQQLAGLGAPTLILWGEQDRMLPPENGPAIAATQTDAELIRVPDAGHLLQVEAPWAVLDALATLSH
jgi:pimeloyl-ACP methyl ester carboxylesterase